MQCAASLTVADAPLAVTAIASSHIAGPTGASSSLTAVTSGSYTLVVNPTIVSGTASDPTVYSYKRFVRASSTSGIIQLSGTSRSYVIFDHCIFDPDYGGYQNTWNCVSINTYGSVNFQHIYFRDCLFKGIFDPATGYSRNRMGFECTARSTSTNYQDIQLERCVFEPTGSEAISFDGAESAANCIVRDVTIQGSGNHPTAYSWGQGFEINGPTDFTVERLTIYPGRGSGTNLGGPDVSQIDCDWTFTDLVCRSDYHPLQKVTRDSTAHPVYAHDMHGSTWTGTVTKAVTGGSSYHAYLSNCDNNDFTGVDWTGTNSIYQTGCTGNTGL